MKWVCEDDGVVKLIIGDPEEYCESSNIFDKKISLIEICLYQLNDKEPVDYNIIIANFIEKVKTYIHVRGKSIGQLAFTISAYYDGWQYSEGDFVYMGNTDNPISHSKINDKLVGMSISSC